MIIAVALAATLVSGPDEFKGFSLDEMIDLSCVAAGELLSEHDAAGGRADYGAQMANFFDGRLSVRDQSQSRYRLAGDLARQRGPNFDWKAEANLCALTLRHLSHTDWEAAR